MLVVKAAPDTILREGFLKKKRAKKA